MDHGEPRRTTTLKDMQAHLEKLLTDAEECALISKLATDGAETGACSPGWVEHLRCQRQRLSARLQPKPLATKGRAASLFERRSVVLEAKDISGYVI